MSTMSYVQLQARLTARHEARADALLSQGLLIEAARAYVTARRHAERAGCEQWAERLAGQAHTCRELYI